MLFDPRRTQAWAKWVYGALAVIFGFTFVFAGVGSGAGLSPTDLLNSITGSGGSSTHVSSSVSAALSKTAKSPNDPQAWVSLGQAYQTDNQPARAVAALEHAARLAKGDVGVQQSLALGYEAYANQLSTKASSLQQLAYVGQQSGSSPLSGSQLDTNFGSAVTQAQASTAQQQATVLYTQASAYQKQAAALQRKEMAVLSALVATPSVRASTSYGNLLLRLGSTAQQVGDKPAAINAFKTFLKAQPAAVEAPQVKAVIKQLEAPATAGATTTTQGG
jgi:tetratricopeptide (TPR) repeat protein